MSGRTPGRRGGERSGGEPRTDRSPAGGGRPRRTGARGADRRPRGGSGHRSEPRRGDASGADPRLLAFDVLLAVEESDAYANLLLPARLARAELSARDAALATELTYGALRGRGLADAVIAHVAARPVADLDARTRTALRLGAHQILSMRIADHAAVSETVTVLRRRGGGRAAGLANAVLRRITERTRDEWEALLTDGASEVDAIALRTSHPAWAVRALAQALRAHGRKDDASGEGLDAVLAADNAPAPVCLAALPGLAERGEVPGAEPHPLSPIGALLTSGDPHDLAAVREGRVRVQDAGSQLVALGLLRAAGGGADDELWLDLCAGPGGKTAVLAAGLAGTGARLRAVDASEHRADLVRDSVRASADTVEVSAADGREYAGARPGEHAAVLVDVPCTGLGALRRRPEARWRRRPEDVAALAPVQTELLSAALASTRSGGVVAYSTCSPHWAETGLIVDDALRASAASGRTVDVLDAPAVLAEITGESAASFASAARGDGAFAQLWPDRHGTDGMFLALLRVG